MAKTTTPPAPRAETARDPHYAAMPRCRERLEGVARDTLYRWARVEPALIVKPLPKKALVDVPLLRRLIAQGGPRQVATASDREAQA
jgi:hypothetical protein